MQRTLLAGVSAALSLIAAQRIGPPPHEAAIQRAYDAAYNLDHEDALREARRAVELGPHESVTHRGLAGILWQRIIFLRGAVSIDHYISGVLDGRLALPKADPALAAEFKASLARAIELAEARLKTNPRDVPARYDVGRAYALQASYTASVESSAMKALGSARRAFSEEEKVLDREPDHPGATFVVGTYRYVIAVLPVHLRALAYLVGFGGGKERGIAMLETAAKDPAMRVDAKTALMLIYTREGRHGDVVRLARELHEEFPRNRLYLLEQGAAAIRAGRPGEADEILTRGLAAFDADPRMKLPGERGFWLYKRGVARVNGRRVVDAQADLVGALEAQPVGWVRGRVHVEIGKLHDLGGRRELALADYRMAKSICEANNDPVCITAANRGISHAYGQSR